MKGDGNVEIDHADFRILIANNNDQLLHDME
jgi:hypothetical protein